MRTPDRSTLRHPHPSAPALSARPPVRRGQWFLVLSCLAAVVLFGWLSRPAVFAAPASQADGPVSVSLVEFAIRMPTELAAGPTTFTVTNNGTVTHNFAIEGQGIAEGFAQNLQPGESNTLSVELLPGEYRVYCPVGNHAAQGMELTLSVTEAAAAPATPTAAPAEATPAMMPTTGHARNASGVYTLPVVALMLLGLATGAWAVQRRRA